jgi:hypothetical protein
MRAGRRRRAPWDWDRSRFFSSSFSSSARAVSAAHARVIFVCRVEAQEPAEVSGRRLADVAALELGRHPIQGGSKKKKRKFRGEISHSLGQSRLSSWLGQAWKRPAWKEAHPGQPAVCSLFDQEDMQLSSTFLPENNCLFMVLCHLSFSVFF